MMQESDARAVSSSTS
jgi:hypothetical protein